MHIIVVAERCFEGTFVLIKSRLVGDDIDRASRGALAEHRPLRSPQNLDPIYVKEAHIERNRVRQKRPVDVK